MKLETKSERQKVSSVYKEFNQVAGEKINEDEMFKIRVQ